MSTLVTDINWPKVTTQLRQLPEGHPIAVDCETTGLRPYSGDVLRGFSFAFYDEAGDIQSFYVPVGYDEGNVTGGALRSICHEIKARNPLYIYHHSKFDLRFLRQLPKDVDASVFFPVPEPYKLWDTKVVAWLFDENHSSSLEVQAQLWLGEGKSDYMKQLVLEKGKAAIREDRPTGRISDSDARSAGWALITAEETAEYGAKDAELTLRLFYTQLDAMLTDHPQLHANPAPAVEREMQVQGLLLRVEDNGILIDTGRVKQLLDSALITMQDIEGYFTEWYATNVGSNLQVAGLLYDTLGVESKTKTKGGARSVDAKTLQRLAKGEHGPIIEKILKHRRLSKAASSYLEPMLMQVADDGCLHPTFWSMGTVTGRLSCSDPNLQTIPRGDTLEGVRDVFVAEEGFELWEYDLQAAEMRVVAGMADEQVLIDGLNDGTDMHGKLAGQVFGEDFTGLQRRQAKNIGYGFFYGLTSPTTAAKYIDGAGATKVATKILEGLKALYPNVVRLMRRESRRAEKQGYIAIGDAWPGRFRRFVTESARKPFAYTALNAEVQGGIGEFMKDVMLAAEPKLYNIGAAIALQVHDSLVLKVPKGEGQYAREILQQVADELNPFKLRMIFDGKPWGEHD